MNKKTVFLLLVCSVALNLGFAGTYGFNMLSRSKATPPSDCPFTSEYTHLYTALGLNQTQLERIEPLARGFHEKAATISKEIVEQRNRLVDEMTRETVDMDTLDAIHEDIAVHQNTMQQLVVLHILDMKQIMNPEQRSRFFEAMRRSFKAQNGIIQ